ncbi:hypothetical protein CS006_06310 [Bifidobacterium primatium]|uniref:N-acetyltransferase domain-containing protein n=2 Tax=Bifidobacterium primatium TaxID=2045438 RepID=A0A2M9H7S5_9BIFI|nr:hypothetical protein CS006_06310 [Bifidobacterium primatium]
MTATVAMIFFMACSLALLTTAPDRYMVCRNCIQHYRSMAIEIRRVCLRWPASMDLILVSQISCRELFRTLPVGRRNTTITISESNHHPSTTTIPWRLSLCLWARRKRRADVQQKHDGMPSRRTVGIMRFLIRRYRSGDAAATLAVFRKSIAGLASHDYDTKQIRVWAGHTGTIWQWDRQRSSTPTWVATPPDDDEAVTGFIDVDENGYIGRLFVDPTHARLGMASMLLTEMEHHTRARGLTQLSVHTSSTARPFFEHHGFHVEQVRHPAIGTISFTNYLMVRP